MRLLSEGIIRLVPLTVGRGINIGRDIALRERRRTVMRRILWVFWLHSSLRTHRTDHFSVLWICGLLRHECWDQGIAAVPDIAYCLTWLQIVDRASGRQQPGLSKSGNCRNPPFPIKGKVL